MALVTGAESAAGRVIGLGRASGGGSIVNVSSISAALHCAAVGHGIRVNSLHPGFCQAPMTEAYWRRKGTWEEGLTTIRGLSPLGRIGEADDGVLYLASDEAGFVTGPELVIDGGFAAQ